MPQTNFHLYEENPVSNYFWGRVPVVYGASLFHFVKGGSVQELIHALKYKGRKDLALGLGQWYGGALKESTLYQQMEVILPVPLHPKRMRSRGYNQSAIFAKGLSESMGIPFEEGKLIREKSTTSQTHKSRIHRFQNVETAFALKQATSLENKHILLVDDVITTGATLEACILPLIEIPGVKVSIATIASVSLS